jgi:hypothetical protein
MLVEELSEDRREEYEPYVRTRLGASRVGLLAQMT